jgi:CBS domain-containing protein
MVMDAFTLMLHHQISYVVVKSTANAERHYISLRCLSELRRDTPEYLSNSITKAQSTYEIKQIMMQLPRLVRNLIEMGTGVASIGKFISKLCDSITTKLIDEAILELGEPPVPFAFLALGSEGRREQSLATDQDNAVVFADQSEKSINAHREYFLALATKVCINLSEVGFPLCKGGVMAMNSNWCMGISEWESRIGQWIETPNPQEVLNTSIFFDFRPVYGDFDLANRLQKFCQRALKDQDMYFYNLAQTTLSIKVSNVEGRDNDTYDIKMPILAITSIARLWSLRYGIGERNTPERLIALRSLGVFSSSHHDEFDQAYLFLTILRLKNQLRQMESVSTPTNNIPIKYFSDIERIMIKKIVSIISDHQARIGIDFRVI